MATRWIVFAFIVAGSGCGRDSQFGRENGTTVPRPQETFPSPAPSTSPADPTPTPYPPRPFTFGLIQLSSTADHRPGGSGIPIQRGFAKVGLSDELQDVAYDAWATDLGCDVFDPIEDGYSWWEGYELGTVVSLAGPATIELPRHGPGHHGREIESGELAPGDYVVSWPGGEGEMSLPAGMLEGVLTYPETISFTAPSAGDSIEIAPGLELRWNASDASTRLTLTIVIPASSWDNSIHMKCYLADDGDFTLPELTNEVPRGPGWMSIKREAVHAIPFGEHDQVLLRGVSQETLPVHKSTGPHY